MLQALLHRAKPLVKRAAYGLGPLPAYHRVANRHHLTVAMFHRILPPSDPRFAYCDPEYTLSVDHLAGCLAFFKQHYNVIPLSSLLNDTLALPERPLLITFDDGWEDNLRYAQPALARAGLPAVIFVAGNAVDGTHPMAFWEMWIIHAFRRRTLSAETCAGLWRAAGETPAPPAFTTLDDCRALITRLEALDEDTLRDTLTPIPELWVSPPGDQHLLTTVQLRQLEQGNFSIEAHGNQHLPLGRAKNPGPDMAQARTVLAAKLGRAASDGPVTMSFPHGSYNPESLRLAQEAGYRLVFTSDAMLNVTAPGQPCPKVMGRLGIDTACVTDEAGRFAPERLALKLFRAPARTLAGA